MPGRHQDRSWRYRSPEWLFSYAGRCASQHRRRPICVALRALGLHDDRLVSAPLLLNFPLALIKLPDEQSARNSGEGLFEQVLVEPPQAGPQLG